MTEKEIWVVESHNHALPLWHIGKRFAKRPLHLLTFDFHTDTCLFWRDADAQGRIAYQDLIQSWNNAKDGKERTQCMKRLSHLIDNDHQIIEAGRFGIIDEVTVVRPCYWLPTEQDRMQIKADCEIKSNFLFAYEEDFSLPDLELGSYILDIDLDFFLEASLFDEIDWRKLHSGSVVTTVAKESEWYAIMCDENGLSIDTALELIKSKLNG